LRRSKIALLASAVCALCFSAVAAYIGASKPSHSPAGGKPTQRSLTVNNMMNDDKSFDNVPFDRDEPAACSPADPGFGWRGLKVRAPSHVVLPDKDSPHSAFIVPLCGRFCVNVAKAIRNPGLQILIVTDEATGHTYRGPIVEREADLLIPPPRSAPLKAEDYEHQAFDGYLNVNVASYVALPLHPARYRLKVEWAGYVSNEVSIAVVQGP